MLKWMKVLVASAATAFTVVMSPSVWAQDARPGAPLVQPAGQPAETAPVSPESPPPDASNRAPQNSASAGDKPQANEGRRHRTCRTINGLILDWSYPNVPFAVSQCDDSEEAQPPEGAVTSFTWAYDFEPEPGMRTWTLNANGSWSEQYPSGRVAKVFDVATRGTVDGCPGALVSSTQEKDFEVFIPDAGCPLMVAKFRRGTDPWNNMGAMNAIKTVAVAGGSNPQ